MPDPTHFHLDANAELSIVFPEGYPYQKLLRIPSGYWSASDADREEVNGHVKEFMVYLRGKLRHL